MAIVWLSYIINNNHAAYIALNPVSLKRFTMLKYEFKTIKTGNLRDSKQQIKKRKIRQNIRSRTRSL